MRAGLAGQVCIGEENLTVVGQVAGGCTVGEQLAERDVLVCRGPVSHFAHADFDLVGLIVLDFLAVDFEGDFVLHVLDVAGLGGSTGTGWCLRIRRIVLRQGGDDLDRFHAESNDLPDEADYVLGVVGVVGIRADAGAIVLLHAVLVDDPLDRAAIPEAVVEDLRRDARQRERIVDLDRLLVAGQLPIEPAGTAGIRKTPEYQMRREKSIRKGDSPRVLARRDQKNCGAGHYVFSGSGKGRSAWISSSDFHSCLRSFLSSAMPEAL